MASSFKKPILINKNPKKISNSFSKFTILPVVYRNTNGLPYMLDIFYATARDYNVMGDESSGHGRNGLDKCAH